MGAKMKVTTHLLNGKRVGQFVDLKPLDESATVKEAIDKGYLVGKLDLVVSTVRGVIRSMAAAIQRDGNGRKIDGIVSIQPSIRLKEKLADNCEPLTKDNVIASLRARVLKDGKVDSSDWTITVEGTTGSLTINSITTGEAMNEVRLGEAINLDGDGLAMSATDTVAWSVPELGKSGTVAAASVTSDVTRITLAADTLAELAALEYDGKTIVFTVTIGGKKAIKSATLVAA